MEPRFNLYANDVAAKFNRRLVTAARLNVLAGLAGGSYAPGQW
ncbi:hypothetical protein ACFV4K_18300 [Nocardia sp. NPDC059764]